MKIMLVMSIQQEKNGSYILLCFKTTHYIDVTSFFNTIYNVSKHNRLNLGQCSKT